MHSQFQDISQRLWIMGEYAENQFEAYCEREGIITLPFGFNRPPFEYFPQIPSNLRAMPDFLCETGKNRLINTLPIISADGWSSNKRMPHRHFFCEVKGCGKDATFKLKDESLDVLSLWQSFTERPVMFFLFDQPQEQIAMIPLDTIREIAPSLDRGYFVDRGKEKPFYRLPTSHELLNWEAACELDGLLTSTDV
jgi:hypothetical protein